MNLKFCGCKACRWSRKLGRNPTMIRAARKGARKSMKMLLRERREDEIQDSISIPYTY